MATPKGMLYPGNTTRIIGHTELWFGKPGRPADTTRSPGYNQQVPADVAAHCKRLKSIGVDVLMFNTYAIGSWENKALEVYMPATKVAGLNFCINIDKGIYDRTGVDPLTTIQAYMAYLRKGAFTLSNYEKWNGKFIVTYFVLPTDSPAVFRQIELENPDCVFVYNDPSKGKSDMAWVHNPGLEATLDTWCTKYATLHDGGLYIPNVSPGFNDTFQGHSVWDVNSSPRVSPPGVGPNAATLQRHFDVLNKHYSLTNQLQYLQLVTINDWDELTAMEMKANGTGGYFSASAPPPPPPKTINHGEVWIDGVKFGDLTPGQHTMTLVQVYSDNSLVRTPTVLEV